MIFRAMVFYAWWSWLSACIGGCGAANKTQVAGPGVAVCSCTQNSQAVLGAMVAMRSADVDWAAEVARLETRGAAVALCVVRCALSAILSGGASPGDSAVIHGRTYLQSRGVTP